MSLSSMSATLSRRINALLAGRENRNLRNRLVMFGALLALTLLLYGVLIVPSSAMLARKESAHADLRKRYAEAVLFQKQKESFAGIRAGIPEQKDMPILIKELVQAALRLNLSVAKVDYDIPRPGGQGLTMLPFSFPVEGSYPGVKRFLFEVESSDRLIGIQQAKMESDRGRVKLQLRLFTYLRER